MGFKKDTFEGKNQSGTNLNYLVHFPQMVSNRYDTTHLNIKALMMLKWHPTTALQLDLLWIVLCHEN